MRSGRYERVDCIIQLRAALEPYLIWIGAGAIVANTASKTSGSLFSLYSPLQVTNEGHKRDADNNESNHCKQSVCPIIVLTAWRIIIVSSFGEQRAIWFCLIAREALWRYPHSNANRALCKREQKFHFLCNIDLSSHFCEVSKKNDLLRIYRVGDCQK